MPGRRSNLANKRFGRWLVLPKCETQDGNLELGRPGRPHWLCRCDCGTEKFVSADALRKGNSKSCGCLDREAKAARLIDRLGQRYGRLTVISLIGRWGRRAGDRRVLWLCRCDCGKEKRVASENLHKGCVQSCGCLRSETNRAKLSSLVRIKHGHALHGKRSREYNVWTSMRARCAVSTLACFKYYGGRGIKVCDRWDPKRGGSFANFLADMGPRPEDASLDRINVDGDYEPNNCRWATSREQARNKQP